MSTNEYIVRVHQEDDGSFWGEVRDLPGCLASGETLDELREALQEAIALYVADEQGYESPVSFSDVPPMKVGEMRVLVSA